VAGVGAIAWSPDGQWLAFRWREGRHGAPPTYEGLRRIRTDGTGLAEIYPTLRPPERYDGIAQISWSPDGSHLAIWLIPSFSSSLAADGGPLLVVSADGGEANQIAEAVLLYPEFAVWSPAGDRLGVVAGAGRETWWNKRLVITTPDGQTVRTLTPPDVAVSSPAWSPDGQRLAYIAMPDRKGVSGGEQARQALMRRRLWVVELGDTPHARQLTDDPAYRDECPLWSADGRHILFVRLDDENRASLWLLPTAGGAPRQVVEELSPSPGWFGYYGHVAWDDLFDWWRGRGTLLQASPQPAATPPAASAPTPEAGITPAPRPALRDVFPLTVDATWVYSVTLDYAEGGQLRHWTGTITETVSAATERAGAWVFLVQETGRHPFHTRPEERVFRYVVMGDRLYRLAGGRRTEPLIRSGGAGYEDALFLRWPMQVGDRWGDPERIAQGLPGYTWEVEALETVETPAGRLAGCYRLAFYTNPDHQLIWFCPGMGIVRREYHHHGSRYDEVWVLRRFSLSGLAVEDLPGPIHLPSDPNIRTTLERVTDLTGDGQPEIVLSYRLLGASSTTTELLVLAPGAEGWSERLRVVLNNWAGGGEWWLEPQPDGTQAVVTTCAAFGVFDAKLLAHPLQRDTYRWDGERFVLAASAQDPPLNRRQVINRAEAALRAGAYRAALATYRRLLEEPDLSDEPRGATAQGKPDWVAYATLRLGQVHALLGEREAALAMLAQAEAAGSTVGRLARRFREAYETTDDPAAAWGALLADTEIYAEEYEDRGNLVAFPGDALGALYPGMALAAVLNDQPQAVGSGPEALRAAWAERGLGVTAILVADLDGDGGDEVVVVQPVTPPRAQTPYLERGLAAAWVLDRGPDGWFAALLERLEGRGDVQLEGPLPVPGTGHQTVRIGTRVRGWDGKQVIRYRDARAWRVEVDPVQCRVRWGGEKGEEAQRKARDALIAFFDLLHEGRYAEAVRYYGGSYEVLRDWNPTVPEDDYATLFRMGCMVNGLQCLRIRRIVREERVSSRGFKFVVEFMNEDGSLFVRGPCCGATEAEMPPQSQFTFTVVKVGDRFLVQELPVYVP